jgi:hypothetical protein
VDSSVTPELGPVSARGTISVGVERSSSISTASELPDSRSRNSSIVGRGGFGSTSPTTVRSRASVARRASGTIESTRHSVRVNRTNRSAQFTALGSRTSLRSSTCTV